jgi:hypothetical protein
MITIKSLKSEISAISDEIKNTSEMKKATENKLRKKISFLLQCISYIETNPSTEFIKSESDRLENFINSKMKEFNVNKYSMMSSKDFNSIKKEFEKMYDIPKKRTQLKALKFLLVE